MQAHKRTEGCSIMLHPKRRVPDRYISKTLAFSIPSSLMPTAALISKPGVYSFLDCHISSPPRRHSSRRSSPTFERTKPIVQHHDCRVSTFSCSTFQALLIASTAVHSSLRVPRILGRGAGDSGESRGCIVSAMHACAVCMRQLCRCMRS